MIPKEQAEILLKSTKAYCFYDGIENYEDETKRCAKIICKNIIDSFIEYLNPETWDLDELIAKDRYEHWQEVQRELEKL